MSVFEERATELVRRLVPEYEKMEFDADIGDTSYQITFFVWINGEKKQCYGLADEGLVNEQIMDDLFAAYVDFVRKHNDYKKGAANIFTFSVSAQIDCNGI